MTRLRHFFMLAFALLSFVLMPATANAAWRSLECVAGAPVANTGLFPADPTARTGACTNADTTQVAQHVFSWVMCNFVYVIDTILSKVYCGMQDTMTGLLAILFTVYIAVFGVQILTGMTQLNVKEIMFRLLKIAGVWTFVTQGFYGIELTLTFFVSLMAYGAYWVLQIITLPALATGGVTFTGAPSNTWLTVFSYMDNLVYQIVVGPFTTSDSKLLGLFAVLAGVMPPLFLMALAWLWMNLKILIDGMRYFLFAISATAFLITLGPIFLSFMLFQITYHFFENWFKYMVSYTLQVIVVFTCIAMTLSITSLFVNFFQEVSKVVFVYQDVQRIANTTDTTVQTWGLCPMAALVNTPTGPSLKCSNGSFNPTTNPADAKDVIPPSKIPEEKDFIYYLTYHLLTLTILAYGFSALVAQAPTIAQQLAGPAYTPIVGQGWGYNRYGQLKSPTAQPQSAATHLADRKQRGDESSWWTSGRTGKIGQTFIDQFQKNLSKRDR